MVISNVFIGGGILVELFFVIASGFLVYTAGFVLGEWLDKKKINR